MYKLSLPFGHGGSRVTSGQPRPPPSGRECWSLYVVIWRSYDRSLHKPHVNDSSGRNSASSRPKLRLLRTQAFPRIGAVDPPILSIYLSKIPHHGTLPLNFSFT